MRYTVYHARVYKRGTYRNPKTQVRLVGTTFMTSDLVAATTYLLSTVIKPSEFVFIFDEEADDSAGAIRAAKLGVRVDFAGVTNLAGIGHGLSS